MNTRRLAWSVPIALTALFTLALGAVPASADNEQWSQL